MKNCENLATKKVRWVGELMDIVCHAAPTAPHVNSVLDLILQQSYAMIPNEKADTSDGANDDCMFICEGEK